VSELYWHAITIIEAQNVLVQFQIADYPHQKKDVRSKLHREFHKMAYPKTHEATETLTVEQLGQRLRTAING